MQIRTVGSNGQISLGTKMAGKTVSIEEMEPGVFIVKVGDFIPRNERWLHSPQTLHSLDEALAWNKAHTPSETDLEELEERVSGKGSP